MRPVKCGIEKNNEPRRPIKKPPSCVPELYMGIGTASRSSVDVFSRPCAVAVIGATDKAGHVGRAILWNLISSPFGGAVYPVNPKRRSVLGLRAYASVLDIPDPVDLAVVITPAETLPSIVRQCGTVGVKRAVIISAGFRETASVGSSWSAKCFQGRGKRICGCSALIA